MKRFPVGCLILLMLVLLSSGCKKYRGATPSLSSKIYGTQIVEVSGGKQVAGVGAKLADPIVVQVNGTDGNAISGALVLFHGDGLALTPNEALTDSSGQVSVSVQLGGIAGGYEVAAETPKQGGGTTSISIREVALGYREKVGKEVSYKYCGNCHDPESTPERVSNLDNLTTPLPHPFTDGNTLNAMSDADLIKIITDGGPALQKSPQTPAYRNTLTQTQIKAIVEYIRAVADPPYQAPGGKR